jgi:uncharacterized membrane protein YgcG
MYRWLMVGLLAWLIGFVALPATAAKPPKRAKAKPKTAAWLPKRPKPFTFVTDKAGLLSPKEEQLLDSSLRRYADTYGPQLVVVTVPSLGGRKVADYARALGTAWGVGQRHKNNGVVVLVAARERSVSIQAGNGLRKVITPSLTASIISDIIGPCFRTQKYFDGLRGTINELVRATAPAEAGPAVYEFIPDPNRWVLAVDSTSQQAARKNKASDETLGFVMAIIVVIAAPILLILLVWAIWHRIRNPEVYAARAAARSDVLYRSAMGSSDGGASSAFDSGSASSSHSHHHHHHHQHDHDSSRHSSGSHRSSSHRSSSSGHSGSSSSSSSSSSYDDSSSDNTGGGGFDDRNDNSGTW